MRPGLDFPCSLDLVVFDERSADGDASSLEKCISHRTADDEAIDTVQKILNHVELVGHFRPTEDGNQRTLRRLQDSSEILELLFHQQACRRLGNVMRDAFHRGVSAMGSSECIIHIKFSE